MEPAAVEQALQQSTFTSFAYSLECGPHNAVHEKIVGYFLQASPNGSRTALQELSMAVSDNLDRSVIRATPCATGSALVAVARRRSEKVDRIRRSRER